MRTFQTIPALLALGLISCGLVARPAEAVPVTGNINFLGNVTLNTNNLATATSITQFRTDSGTVGGLNVSGTTGSFNLVGIGTFATFTAPYTFNPSSSSPIFWQIGGFSFNLLSSQPVSQNASFLEVRGTGIVTGNGFDPTPGTWSFILTSPTGGTGRMFGFATNTAGPPHGQPVPEGGPALAFLVVSLLSLEAFRRRLTAA